LKRPRSYERYEKEDTRFGRSKAPRNPLGVGEEYIVTIEEAGKSGIGVAKIRGFVLLVNNSNPGEKVKIRIKKVSRGHAVADVINDRVVRDKI
jgi:predicted RNA-binding protein with TRAM domain